MTIQLSTAVRNARLDVIESTIGTAPTLKIWSGAMPANCAAADTGTQLASPTLPSDWESNASGGSKSMLGTWEDTSADNNGYAGFFRLYDSGGNCHMQGLAAEAWAASEAVVVGQQLYSGSHAYRVTTAGTTGTTSPTFSSGSAADGTATLTYIGEVDMTLDNSNLKTGEDFKITSFTLTDANA